MRAMIESERSTPRRVLVTGGTGFIGRQVAARLISGGDDVWVTASPASSARPPVGAAVEKVDLRLPSACEELIARVAPTHLVHLAWVTSPGACYTSVENLAWVTSSLALVRSFVAHGGRRLVVAGTCAEYDPAHGVCNEDTTPLNPETLYGASKDSLRRLIEAWGRTVGLSWGWARLFFVYGPHEATGRLVPSVLSSLLRGDAPRCTHGRMVRDYIHVDDAARALVQILASDFVGAVNVGTGEGQAVRTIVDVMHSLVPCAPSPLFGAIEAKGVEADEIVASTQRLRERVGFTPSVDLRAGLASSLAWLREADDVVGGRDSSATVRAGA